jgi:pyridoxal phosphate enzyme (YggS family)
MNNIADNLNKIHQRFHQITKNVVRNHNVIILLAVSKGQSSQAIRQSYDAGQRHFGENYLQEALEKQQQLSDLADITWHFIGPVQSNKTRKVAESFDWVHSVDRYRVAERLSTQRQSDKPPLNLCLQVNINEEESKSGLRMDEVGTLAQTVMKLPHLTLRGLMAIPKAHQTIEEQHQSFAAVSALLTKLRNNSPELATLDTLSMGMSADLDIAIAEGSTVVRIGTAIFGPRQYPNTHQTSNNT